MTENIEEIKNNSIEEKRALIQEWINNPIVRDILAPAKFSYDLSDAEEYELIESLFDLANKYNWASDIVPKHKNSKKLRERFKVPLKHILYPLYNTLDLTHRRHFKRFDRFEHRTGTGTTIDGIEQ